MSRSDDYKDGYLAQMARQVARGFSRDDAVKQRMIERDPSIAYGMDAVAVAEISPHELAILKLKQLGIPRPQKSDAVEILDALHAYEQRRVAHARGFAQDSTDAPSFLDRYLNAE